MRPVPHFWPRLPEVGIFDRVKAKSVPRLESRTESLLNQCHPRAECVGEQSQPTHVFRTLRLPDGCEQTRSINFVVRGLAF